MAQIFPKWTNRLPAIIAIIVVLGGIKVIAGFWYFGSPKYTDVGYRPTQPVSYSHKLHAGDLGIDCRYCHVSVETSSVSNIPPTKTCMNCHTMIGIENPKLAPVYDSWATGKSIEWVRIHQMPDYAYFDHSLHLNAGVGCVSCHGRVDQMVVVEQKEPLSMSWCLDCHRNPDPNLRPVDQVTNMEWVPGPDHADFVASLRKDRKIEPPEDCTGCHR